jgi:hypothetical protein
MSEVAKATKAAVDSMPQPKPVFFDATAAVMPDTSLLETGQAGNFSIAINYHEFEQDAPIRGIYMGIGTYQCLDNDSGELKTLRGPVFVTQKQIRGVNVNEAKINCAVKFLSALENMPQGFAFEATMTGRKPKGDRSICQFHIVELQRK